MRVPGDGDGCLDRVEALGIPAFLIDRTGRLVHANRCWSGEYSVLADAPWEWLAPVTDDSRPRLRRVVAGAFDTGRPAEVEFALHRRDGSLATLVCTLGPSDPGAADSALLGMCWDVSDRVRNEQRLAFMAGHDVLTGLANRHTFEDALGRAVSRVERGGTAVLLMIDLDHLKAYNDSRGHLEGDQALVNLAMLLRTHVRAVDLPARIGGDEFAVLLEDADLDKAVEIAARIREAAGEVEFVAGAREHELGVSIGVTRIVAGLQPRAIIDRADSALYRAKESGRNRVVVWEDIAAEGIPVESSVPDIPDAFSRDAFWLAFQPVVNIADGEIAYYESLVRLSAPDGGTVRPDEFLPAVERHGLMGRLTRSVLQMALARLAENPGITVSVNLSQSDLVDEALLGEVDGLIGEAGEAGSRLRFEISEETLLANLADGRAWMERLGARGIRFVLDDFGSGVGVFVLLREPGIGQVKLSRTVMRALGQETATHGFVAAMRELIESQGRVAVASYVESESMLANAEAAGFTWAQGYELSEPTRDLEALVARMGERRVG